MIFALIKAQWISLLRDRMAMGLTFALPCIMFTVFAVIFGGNNGATEVSKVKVIVVDVDKSRVSSKMIESLRTMEQISVESLPDGPRNGSEAPKDSRMAAAKLVKTGKAAAAVVFPDGLEESVGLFGAGGDRAAVEVIYDSSNPIAQQMLTGVLQASAFTSVPDILITQGLDQFRQFGGAFSPMQEAAVATLKTLVTQETGSDAPDVTGDANAAGGLNRMSMSDGLVRIQSTSAGELFTEASSNSGKITGQNMISYYAAGISVMFIMFSMSGAASSLLEHEEKGTLERLLSGGLTVFRLLIAHWLFYVLLGVMQIGLMLGFASIVFGLDLWHGPQLIGGAVMALVSSMASAAFIMMLATLCKSRKQLEGLSAIVILIMSAIGGSMMPRFIMPKFVLNLSSVAFNAWAMDGFLDVFWHYIPGESILMAIAKEVCVILVMAAAFLAVAFVSSRRWAVK